MSHWKKRHHILMIVVLSLALAPLVRYAPNFRPDVYATGFEILEKQGPEAALEYWTGEAAKGNLDGFVGEATIRSILGERVEPERLARYVVVEAEGLTKARGMFLLGSLLRAGDCHEVIINFGGALRLFKEHGYAYRIFRSRSGPGLPVAKQTQAGRRVADAAQ
ncbi:MAG: hypothetical protein QNK37_13165 [Acidobacteriota bacterium]|nr:hypothetical protein [Acidobacteriota bacterium]